MQSTDRKKQILQAIRFDVWKTRFGNDMSLTNFDFAVRLAQ